MLRRTGLIALAAIADTWRIVRSSRRAGENPRRLGGGAGFAGAGAVCANKGVAKHLGKSYTYDTIYYGASPKQITALNVGELDIAALGFSSFPLRRAERRADRPAHHRRRNPGRRRDYFTGHFMVRKDSGINKIEDLKGKVLATNGLGSGVHMAMTRDAQAPRPAGEPRLHGDRGALPHHDGGAEGEEGRHDHHHDAVHLGDRTCRTSPRRCSPTRMRSARSELSFWTAREGFIKKNRAAMVDFLEDAIRATRWYKDPANRTRSDRHPVEIPQAAAGSLPAMGVHQEGFLSATTICWSTSTRLQRNVDTMKDIGVIKSGMTVKDYADLSLVKEAAARLK